MANKLILGKKPQINFDYFSTTIIRMNDGMMLSSISSKDTEIK